MKINWALIGGVVVALFVVLIGVWGSTHLKGAQLVIFVALIGLIAVAAAAVILFFKNRHDKPAAAAPPPDPGGDTEIDTLVREADRRLASANAGATIANLPLIFVIGDRGTAKTSTVVNSGIEAELLAGQLYQDNAIAPTQTANLWFARGTALVESGGAVLGDPGNWMRLVKRLRPGKLKSLKGGAQSPRAVLLCVSLELFTQQGGADAITGAARYLQARLAEVAQTLGIRFPVYILFTKTDRVPFFIEFVSTFSNEEVSQVFGVTLPIRPAQQTGVYAEDETRRLAGYFDNLFYSLCDRRTVFPPRHTELEKICGAYEFPREMRKARDAMVRFMVDVCRPSQLTTSPFLRGFYFSGVRPIVVSDAAPIVAPRQQSEYQAQGASGATGIFRVGKQAEMLAQQAVAQSAPSARKVPQWTFLGPLFNNIILSDTAAMSASGSSVKVSALRRGLLIAASVVSLIIGGFFLASYLGNRTLERQAITAARNIPGKPVPAGEVPSLASLQQLETLRQSLETLDGYESDGAPYRIRWGLYQGSDMRPYVYRLYFAKFRALLFGQTQTGLVNYMQHTKTAPDPSDEYGYPYDTLKAYLLTTSEYKRTSDRSLQDFLGTLLLTRWGDSVKQEVGKEQRELAKKQFDYYARSLPNGNPYSDRGDADAVEHVRVYLSGFKGVQRVYRGLLAAVAKKGKSITFNEWAPGSAETVTSVHPIAFAYTKDGSKAMLDDIRRANFAGEKWVLGPYTGQSEDVVLMQKGVTELYNKDYINQWRTVLRTSHVVRYANLKDAAEKLDKLTHSDAPILALLAWTSKNTSVPDMPDVNEAFRAVRQIEPPDAPAYVPSAQPYNDALQNLQASIAKATETNLEAPAVAAVQQSADSATQATKKISSGLPVDREGQVDSTVGALMLEPITLAQKALVGVDADKLNGDGKAFCASFGPITRKFPFNQTAKDEVTLKELAEIFRPKDGKVWTMYEGGIKKVMDCTGGDCKPVEKPPVTLNPAFLNFFRQLVRFSHALYGDTGTDPKMQYSLRPKKTDWVEEFEMEVNGDSWKTDGDEQKSFVWPGGPKQNFILNLKLGKSLPVKAFDGPWAVFRFLADANRMTVNGSSYDFVWNFRSGQTNTARPLEYEFILDANGAPLFNRDFLASMKCVPTVAK